MRRFLLLALGLSFACGSGLQERPCSDDSGCPSQQTCIAGRCASSGFCVGSPSCNGNAACAPGQHCQTGCCVPGEAESCVRDVDCPAQSGTPVCDASTSTCVGCLVARDCGPASLCAKQSCEPLRRCASNGDCAKPAPLCDLQQHACVQCLDARDCPNPAAPACSAAHSCTGPCTGDADCAAPAPRCLAATASCVACLASGDCPFPKQCDPLQHVCLIPGATTCAKEQDCAANGAAPHCLPGSAGRPGTCVACIADGQCPAGEICNQNTCAPRACSADADCAAPAPRCLTGLTPQVCVACLLDADCPGGGACQPDHTCRTAPGCGQCPLPTPVCGAAGGCAGCAQASDCAATETCSAGACVSTRCASDADCAALADLRRCDTSAGTCVAVQCAQDSDCTNGLGCDLAAHTCTVPVTAGPRCDPYAKSCAVGTICAWRDFDAAGAFEGSCLAPNGQGTPGDACDPSMRDSCEWNLICVPASATSGVCRALCDPAQGNTCATGACNAIAGAVSSAGAVDKFGYCGPASAWGQTCTADTPAPAGAIGDCGEDTSGAGTGASLYCSPSLLPAESPQRSVRGICRFTPAAATATGGAGDSCAAHAGDDCRTGACLSDGPLTCFAGCASDADCSRDGAPDTVHCFDVGFPTRDEANQVASCEPACRGDADCFALLPAGPGRTCAPRPTHDGSSWRTACAPVAGSGPPGAPCTGASACASGLCVTARALQQIELGQAAPGLASTDGFCLGSASSAGDCGIAGTVFSEDVALPLAPADGERAVMGRPNPGVCWPMACATDSNCAGLSLDPAAPRVCAPYKTTAVTTVDGAAACSSDSDCTAPGICNAPVNNPDPGGVYGKEAGIFGPNGRCRQVRWALSCAPSLGAAKSGAGAACTGSMDCRTGHCVAPPSGSAYCFGGCASDGDCEGGSQCRLGSYLGLTMMLCQR